ncbi:MAG: L-iditol 2-dehydrogenase [Candidatus Pacebacteria bacterium]|nr:L-iditol 2-dehydrogenase [Candidatus Paceibacterota bacterium]
MTGRLQNKTVLITGGTQGIGFGFAEAMISEGARVCVTGLTVEEADRAVLKLGHRSLGYQMDLRQQSEIEDTVAKAWKELGTIDILINNAGVIELLPIVEITRKSFDTQFAINVAGTLFTMQAVAKFMISEHRKLDNPGKIINMASQAGRRGEGLAGVYCASKAAVISLTQSAALDLIKYNINVNAIAPGVVNTPMWDTVDAQFGKYEGLAIGQKKEQVAHQVPIGRFGDPKDMAGMAIFLASSESNYILAQTFGVDGGNWMA